MMHRRSLIPLVNELEELKNFFDFDGERYGCLSKSENEGLSVYEDEGNVYVEAALPGVSKKDVKIVFEKGVLWIKAESKSEKKDVKYHLKSQESFSYRILIPSRVDENSSPDASLKDGMLTIAFAKSKSAKAKTIDIKD